MTIYYLKDGGAELRTPMEYAPTIIFAGEHLPPTTNNLRQPGRGRGGKPRIVSTDAYRTWSTFVSAKLNEQANLGIITRLLPDTLFRARFFLGLWGRISTSADMMNREKAAIDVMVKAGILPGDSVKLFRHSEFFVIDIKDNWFSEPFFAVSYQAATFDPSDIHATTMTVRRNLGHLIKVEGYAPY